jgi:hypothetical protein
MICAAATFLPSRYIFWLPLSHFPKANFTFFLSLSLSLSLSPSAQAVTAAAAVLSTQQVCHLNATDCNVSRISSFSCSIRMLMQLDKGKTNTVDMTSRKSRTDR